MSVPPVLRMLRSAPNSEETGPRTVYVTLHVLGGDGLGEAAGGAGATSPPASAPAVRFCRPPANTTPARNVSTSTTAPDSVHGQRRGRRGIQGGGAGSAGRAMTRVPAPTGTRRGAGALAATGCRAASSASSARRRASEALVGRAPGLGDRQAAITAAPSRGTPCRPGGRGTPPGAPRDTSTPRGDTTGAPPAPPPAPPSAAPQQGGPRNAPPPPPPA